MCSLYTKSVFDTGRALESAELKLEIWLEGKKKNARAKPAEDQEAFVKGFGEFEEEKKNLRARLHANLEFGRQNDLKLAENMGAMQQKINTLQSANMAPIGPSATGIAAAVVEKLGTKSIFTAPPPLPTLSHQPAPTI